MSYRKKRKLTDNDKLHNILSKLNVVNGGGFYPIQHIIQLGFLEGLSEEYIRKNLAQRVKDGLIIIDKDLMKLGC